MTDAILDRTGTLADRATTWPSDADPARRRELGVVEVGPSGPVPDRATA